MSAPMEDPLSRVEESRSEAISSAHSGVMYLGGGAALIGLAFLAAPLLLSGEFVILGTLVAGVGLVKLGGVARHLFRFGKGFPMVALASVAALGALVAAWPGLVVLEWIGIADWPGWFKRSFGASVRWLFYVTVLLGLTAFLFRDRSTPDAPAGPDA